MSDKPDNDRTDETGSDPSSQTKNSDHMIPKSRFDEINNRYRALEKEMEALRQSQQEREAEAQQQREKEMAEQNRYKELYEGAQAEIEKLKALQGEVTRYREGFESTVQSRLDQIPEDKKHLVPEFDDPIRLSAWLDKAMPDLVARGKPQPPPLDGGSGTSAGTDGGNQTALSPGQAALAEYARQNGWNINSDRLRKIARNPAQQTDLEKRE